MTGINHLPTNHLALLNSNILHKSGGLQNHSVKNQAQQQAQNNLQQQTPQQQAFQQTQLLPRKPSQATPQQNILPQLSHAIRNPISLTPIGNAVSVSAILPEVSQIFSQISDLLVQNNTASLVKFQQNIPNLNQQNFAQKIVQYLVQIGKGGEHYQSLLEGLHLNQSLDKRLKQLFGRLEQLSRQILNDKDGDAWQRLFLPLLSDKQMQFITFYVPYHGQEKPKQNPKQNEKQKQESREKKEKQDKKTQRFILSFDFSGTGMIEIDLYMEQEKRIYMVLRTLKKVDAEIQQMMRALIENVTASMGLDGFLAFQQATTLIEMPLDASANILCGKIL